MNIYLYIEPDGPGVVTFDPPKVMDRIKEAFPTFTTDRRNYAQEDFDRARQSLIERGIPEDRRRRLEAQLRGKVERNGPSYHFEIEGLHGTRIMGSVRRYRTTFRSTIPMDAALQEAVIQVLRTFQVGIIQCDTQTEIFVTPSQAYPGLWELAP